MKFNIIAVYVVFLVFVVLSVLVLSPLQLPFKIPKVKAQEGESNVFGNPSLPDWKNITVTEDSDFVVVDNADGFVFKFRKGTAGYNVIFQNGSQIVEDERWRLEYLFKTPDTWRMRGEPQYVTWIQPEPYHVVVKRFYMDYEGTTFNVSYSFYGGFRPKINFEGNIAQTDEYRIQWRISGINKTYVSENATKSHVKFWNEGEEAVCFDYSDVYESFGDVTTVEVEEWANNHKLNEIFNVGSLGIGEFRLDPTFGYETKGGTSASIEDYIRGSKFWVHGEGLLYNITVYLYVTIKAHNVKCAVYNSDFSLLASTESKSVAKDTNAWVTFTFTSPPFLVTTMNYWLFVWGDAQAGDVVVYYDGGASDQGLYKSVVFDDWQETLSGYTLGNMKFSIYGHYESLSPQWTTPDAVHSFCGEFGVYVAGRAIDDDLGLYWRHKVDCYHWIIFDMAETKTITKIRIYQEINAIYYWGYDVGLYVYVSDDPEAFGDAVWDGTLFAIGWQESGAFEKNGRYIKLVSKYGSLNEIMHEFDAYAEAAAGDETAPTYSDVGTNTTVAGQPCKFSTKWTDETGLATTGGYIYGTNNTGTFTNETWSAFSSNPDWSNATKTLNSTVGYVIQWQIWANDTSNNWNNTGTQSLTTAFYSEISADETFSWNINPGQNNVTINEGVLHLTTTANAAYDIQVKGSGDLTNGPYTISLSNVLVENDTLADAIALTTEYQDIPGLTNLPSGTDVELTFILWLSCPVGRLPLEYTFTLYVKVQQAS